MNLIPEPRCPEGSDRQAAFMRWVWWKLARYLRFHSSPTVQFEQNSNGITAHVKVRAAGSVTQGGGGMNYRGLWMLNAPSPYMLNDVVKIQFGISAGLYLSLVNNNVQAPDTGNGWVQLAVGDVVGRWD